MNNSIHKPMALLIWSYYSRNLVAILISYLLMVWLTTEFTSNINSQYAPIITTLIISVAIIIPAFTFVGQAWDLTSRESVFPKYLYSLPASTNKLIFWPVLYGSISLILLWFITSQLVSNFLNVTSIMFWPSVMSVSLLVWIQALVWFPLRQGWIRFIYLITVTAIHIIIFIKLRAHTITEPTAIFFMLGLLPVAYGVALWGVSLARRGEPSKTGKLTTWKKAGWPSIRNRSLSPLQAQSWLEWRLHGRAPFYILLACVIFSSLITAIIAFLDPDKLDFKFFLRIGTVFSLLLPFLIFISASYSWASFNSRFYMPYSMPSYLATLPMTTGEFIWAKFRAVFKSNLLILIIALLFFISSAVIYGEDFNKNQILNGMLQQYSNTEIFFVTLLILFLYFFYLFANTLNIIWILMTDRIGINGISIIILAMFILLPAFHPAGLWLDNRYPVLRSSLLENLPFILIIMALLKLVVLAKLTRSVNTKVLFSGSRIRNIISCWFITIIVVYSIYTRYVPDDVIAWYTALSLTVILTPVLGIMAAPLALHYNRHR